MVAWVVMVPEVSSESGTAVGLTESRDHETEGGGAGGAGGGAPAGGDGGAAGGEDEDECDAPDATLEPVCAGPEDEPEGDGAWRATLWAATRAGRARMGSNARRMAGVAGLGGQVVTTDEEEGTQGPGDVRKEGHRRGSRGRGRERFYSEGQSEGRRERATARIEWAARQKVIQGRERCERSRKLISELIQQTDPATHAEPAAAEARWKTQADRTQPRASLSP